MPQVPAQAERPFSEPGGAPDARPSVTDPIFNILLLCSSWTLGHLFLKYRIKILFVLVTRFFGTPLNCYPPLAFLLV